jgi:hypothetical protein
VGDLRDHDLGIVGLPDGGLDFLDLEQFAARRFRVVYGT